MRDVRQRVRGRAAVERVRAILDTAAGDELDELVATLERLAERGAAS